MTHILKNQNLEIHIDHPTENYKFSRFDWTGKIVEVKFQDIVLSSTETTDDQNEHLLGKGFYNEFGIDTALGFDETEIGDWFHKIGVGLLKKEHNEYLFSKPYKIKPAEFQVRMEMDRLFMKCRSENVNGYSYVLEKEIALHESGFTLKYHLYNTGEKDIIIDEYVHNFTAIDKAHIADYYVLNFPFQLKPELFRETVNREQKVDIGQKDVKFNGTPKEPFFFSDLSGSKYVDAHWELSNLQSKIGISETGSFQTNKVNLWGTRHVISPELFFSISIKPGESVVWSRQYEMYRVK